MIDICVQDFRDIRAIGYATLRSQKLTDKGSSNKYKFSYSVNDT